MGVTLALYNTLSGKKEALTKTHRTLRLFVCGPTVYDYLHIGNARTYLVFDAFVSYLHSRGVRVFYLQNITDIDDKIIARAERDLTSARLIAARYKKIYIESMRSLGIHSVDRYASATGYIKEIISQVRRLIKKNHVYRIEGDGYYFDVTTFPDYGALSRRTALQAEDGVSRIDESLKKRNKADFCVWKFSKKGGLFWKTLLGNGRPGWHIEDTAITEHFFGPQYDIHGGGVDLKFPHHEAEIAQQESLSGKKPFVKIWMHVGALTVQGKKMSKSLGNYIIIDDFLSRYPPQVLRLISLTHHYRSPVDYTETLATSHASAWHGVEEFLAKLTFVMAHSKVRHKAELGLVSAEVEFHHALEDDFNTPAALSRLFGLMNKIQPILWKLSKNDAKSVRRFLTLRLLSLGFSTSLLPLTRSIRTLVSAREAYRSNEQFAHADRLRKELDDLGYVVEDTPLGPFISRKSGT